MNGYKRYVASGAYEFVYPDSWLEDVTLYRRRIERAEFQRGVEFKQLEDMERVAKGQAVVQPAVGFGPPAGTGEENLSVVAAPSPGLVCVPLATSSCHCFDAAAQASAHMSLPASSFSPTGLSLSLRDGTTSLKPDVRHGHHVVVLRLYPKL